MNRPLFFLHIPKTAGTSLRIALEGLYKPNEILPDRLMMQRSGGHYPPDIIPAFSLKYQREAVRLVRGHYHFCLSDLMDDPLIITVLREPVARTISNLRHLTRGRDKSNVMRALSEGRLPIENNLMTRYLGDNVDPLSPTRNRRDFLDGPIADPAALLESAKRRLSKIQCLGVVEQMDAFVDLLGAYGISVELGRSNVAPDEEFPLDGTQMETIRRHNELDAELYRAAVATIASRRMTQVA